MVRPELGNKRTCIACSTRFYDLGRTPVICPKCHTEQPPEQPRVKRPAIPEDKRPKKPLPTPGLEDAEAEVVEETAPEGEAIEDTAELEDDPDAISAGIEVVPGEEESEG